MNNVIDIDNRDKDLVIANQEEQIQALKERIRQLEEELIIQKAIWRDVPRSEL